MNIQKYKNAWYYSTGLFTEHTQAIYFPKEAQLTIINLKYLPKVLQHLQKELNINEITLKW